MTLTDRQIELYSRQIILRELGGTGQRRLLASSCIVLGNDSALSYATSYLAGAGVGKIDLAPLDPSDPLARGALAPLDDRSPDVKISLLDPGAGIDLTNYDVTLVSFFGERSASYARRARGCSRLGSISLGTSLEGASELVLLPASAPGCPWCVGARSNTVSTIASLDAAARALGATLAALAALRWLAGIALEDAPRALTLATGAATWQEAEPRLEPGCVRGCRT